MFVLEIQVITIKITHVEDSMKQLQLSKDIMIRPIYNGWTIYPRMAEPLIADDEAYHFLKNPDIHP